MTEKKQKKPEGKTKAVLKEYTGIVLTSFSFKDSFHKEGAVFKTTNKKTFDYLISINKIKDGNNK